MLITKAFYLEAEGDLRSGTATTQFGLPGRSLRDADAQLPILCLQRTLGSPATSVGNRVQPGLAGARQGHVAFEEWVPSTRGRHALSEWTGATLHLKVPYHPSACLPSKASRLSHPQAILLLTARRAACVDSVLDRTPRRPQQTEPMNRVAQARLTVLTTAPAATLITCTTSPTNQA
jgi:hypothetical protein